MVCLKLGLRQARKVRRRPENAQLLCALQEASNAEDAAPLQLGIYLMDAGNVLEAGWGLELQTSYMASRRPALYQLQGYADHVRGSRMWGWLKNVEATFGAQ